MTGAFTLETDALHFKTFGLKIGITESPTPKNVIGNTFGTNLLREERRAVRVCGIRMARRPAAASGWPDELVRQFGRICGYERVMR